MKKIRYQALSIILLALLVFKSFGQNQVALKPEKVEIDNAGVVRILTDFIEDAKQNSAFYEDKGIIQLTVCPGDSAGQIKYTLQVLIDNRYEDNSIRKYAYYENYVVLFDSCGFSIKIPDRDQYFKDINEEIGDRVYKRPAKKGRRMTYRSKDGKTITGINEPKVLRAGGGQQNARVYIVDTDNKFKKFKTV